MIRDAETEALIRTYAKPIFQAAGLGSQAIEIHIVNDRSFNAFVVDGHNMFIHAGTLMEAKTPNQVIGVIAHESGHITGGHLARLRTQLSRAKSAALMLQLLGLAAMAAGALGGRARSRTGGHGRRLCAAASTNTLSESIPMAASIARFISRLSFFCCGLWSRGDRGRSCQLGVEDEQQRLVVRERHAVGLRGVAHDRRDEPFLVRCAGVEPALAREHPLHTHRGEARYPRLDRGKITPRPWLGRCSTTIRPSSQRSPKPCHFRDAGHSHDRLSSSSSAAFVAQGLKWLAFTPVRRVRARARAANDRVPRACQGGRVWRAPRARWPRPPCRYP